MFPKPLTKRAFRLTHVNAASATAACNGVNDTRCFTVKSIFEVIFVVGSRDEGTLSCVSASLAIWTRAGKCAWMRIRVSVEIQARAYQHLLQATGFPEGFDRDIRENVPRFRVIDQSPIEKLDNGRNTVLWDAPAIPTQQLVSILSTSFGYRSLN